MGEGISEGEGDEEGEKRWSAEWGKGEVRREEGERWWKRAGRGRKSEEGRWEG